MSAERMCMSCKPCTEQMPFDLEEYREQIRAEVIYSVKSIVKNYHAHIDDNTITNIFDDLERLKKGE